MHTRFQNSPAETKQMNTQQLRENFLIQRLIEDDQLNLVYSHYDRVIVGGARPVLKALALENNPELRSEYFLQRRELGIINIGGKGSIEVDSVDYAMERLSCLYIGLGGKEVYFKSDDAANPAAYYMLSAPAHLTYPTRLMVKEEAEGGELGDVSTANKRNIYRYIHEDGIQSCQLVMGLTILNEGSVWNTMPAHTHTRRMEAYFYFDVPELHRVIHFMGEPQETRHLVMANNEAVLSAPWSIHSGCGTASYSFIWGMAGENYTYSDMDAVAIGDLR